MLKAGVIGCGNIAKFHFSGLEKAGIKIAWVCDLSQQAAQPWAKKFSAKYTAGYKDVITDPQVDVVVIATISTVHKQICIAAINAGKAVICEKTLTDNADDSAEIVKLTEKKGTIFYTSYMKRFIPAVQKAKELLPSLGRIVSTHIRTYQCWGNLWDEEPKEGIFHTPAGGISLIKKAYGGGVLVCGGSHILDLILFFLGRPTKLYASMYTPPKRDYDLQAAALIETEHGIVHYEALAHPLNKIGFLKDGWDEVIEINGTNGRLKIFSAAWDQADFKSSLLVHYDNTTGQSIEYRFNPVSPFDKAIEFFCRNIENKTQGAQSRITGYEVDELINHIEKSASCGQAVEINWRV